MGKATLLIAVFNTPLYNTVEQADKISKIIKQQNSTMNKLDLINVCETLHPPIAFSLVNMEHSPK